MKASAGLSGAANVAATSPKLRVSILVADARADYTVQDLGATASAAAPVVAAAYAIPISTVAYIDLALGVVLDDTGRFKFIPDTVSLADSTAFAVTKSLVDAPAAIDATFVSALKVLADGFAMNDGSEAVDGSVYSFSKGIQNVAFTNDAVAASLAKLNQDQIALLDNAAKVLSRPVADSFGTADSETVAALKGLSDSAELQDVVAVLLVAIREFNDAVGSSDADSKVFTPAVKVEQVAVADNDTFVVQKPFTEGLTAQDASAYTLTTGFLDAAAVADNDSLVFTASRVESVSAADVGLLSVQDYCALDYFAEDYVGFSQAF